MQYEVHNFPMNFSNAAGIHPEMADELVVHELAELLVNDKASVISVVRSAGVQVPDNATRNGLINIISDNAADNAILRTNLANLIADKNTGSRYSNTTGCPPGYIEDYFGHCNKAPRSHSSSFDGGITPGAFDRHWSNADGDAQPQQKQDDSDLYGKIASQIGNLFGNLKNKHEKKKQQQNAKSQLKTTTEQKATQQGAPKEGLSGLQITGIVVGGVAVVSLIGFLIYKAIRKK